MKTTINNVRWVDAKNTHGATSKGYIGSVCTFNIGFYGYRTTGRNIRYKLTGRLPGYGSLLGHYEDIQKAKERAERVLIDWIHKSRIQEVQLPENSHG